VFGDATVTKFCTLGSLLVFVHFNAGSLCAAAPDVHPLPPVVLISIDTLRADHVGAYGYRRVATPNIDSFVRGGTLFANIACQTPLTLPSHTSLFTSTYPCENGIQENAEPVPPGAGTLAAVLRSHGYKTAAFIGSVFLERQMGLDHLRAELALRRRPKPHRRRRGFSPRSAISLPNHTREWETPEPRFVLRSDWTDSAGPGGRIGRSLRASPEPRKYYLRS
jgi:arylsulfatase A-like enzyme